MEQTMEKRVAVLQEVLAERMSCDEAVALLGCSRRTVYRYLARFREKGPDGLVHGLKGRRSNRAKPQAVRDEVVALYSEQYKGMAVNAFVRDVVAGKGVKLSRETVRKWLIDSGLWEATARKAAEEN